MCPTQMSVGNSKNKHVHNSANTKDDSYGSFLPESFTPHLTVWHMIDGSCVYFHEIV